MDWIKKNPAKFAVLCVATLVIAATFMLYQRVSGIDATFEALRATPPPRAKVDPLSTEAIDAAQKALNTPAIWQPQKGEGRLLTSRLYVFKDGRLVSLDVPGQSFQKPVPNDWLTQYGLDPLNNHVLEEDPDKDGFTTREEWNGNDTLSHLDNDGQPVMEADGKPLPADSTNPVDPKSHPPYHTKLQLAKVVFIPFRLRFMSYDINPKDPKDITVQINTIDSGNRTKYIKVGEDIPATKFKTEKFEQKEVPGKDGTTKDASELTIKNKETGVTVILPKGIVVDSPDSYGVFRYLWVGPGGEKTPDLPKRRGDTISIPPDADQIYKVIDIKPDEALLELPGGEKKTFKLTP
jgi:hypothetical protein